MNLGIENETTEFKKSTSELKEGVASIASILNKHGSGQLYFGVTPHGEICGQDVSGETLRQISQSIAMSIEPRIVPEISVHSSEGKEYIKVTFAGTDSPYSCKGTYRIRTADEDTTMTASQIESMLAKRLETKTPWEARQSRLSFADIDEETLRTYIERGRGKNRIPFTYSNIEDVLGRLDLLADGVPTNAASVLFGKTGDIRLKMGILETHSRTRILDLHQESGTVFDLVDKGVAYIIGNTRRRFEMDGFGPREEIPEIPPLAIREALMNAFAHQDWSQNGFVQVDIFNDTVEILSPGWFIEGQDPFAHLTGESASSRSRNALITKTLYRSGDIESYGTGIPRMRELCDEIGMRIEYQKTLDGTKLVFHRNDAFSDEAYGTSQNRPDSARIGQNRPESARIDQNRPDGGPEAALAKMSETDNRVFEYLDLQDKAPASEISDALGIPNRTVRNALTRLIESGLVSSTGKGRSTKYQIASR